MSKTHFISVNAPVAMWEHLKVVSALCGDKVENAAPVFKVDLQAGYIESASTLYFCRVCLMMAFAPMSGVKYIYGVLPQQEAHRLNHGDALGDE